MNIRKYSVCSCAEKLRASKLLTLDRPVVTKEGFCVVARNGCKRSAQSATAFIGYGSLCRPSVTVAAATLQVASTLQTPIPAARDSCQASPARHTHTHVHASLKTSAMAVQEVFTWEPAQDLPRQSIDLRELPACTARGYKVGPSSKANTTKTQPAIKRKREELENAQQPEDEMHVDAMSASVDVQPRKVSKRNVVGVNNARCWKQPVEKRSSASVKSASRSWEQKVRPRSHDLASSSHAQ